VTIYAFSIENFKRSKYEVDALMEMIKVKLSQLSEHGELLDRYGVSIRVLGRRELVRSDVLEAVDRAMEITSRNGNAILNVCFPYTARDEITTAVQNTVIDYSTPLDRTQVQASSGRRPFSQSHIAQSIRETSPSAGRPEDSSGSGSGSDDATASDTNGGDASPDSQSSSFSSTTTLHPVLQQSPSASVTKLTTVPEIFSSYPPNSDQLIFRSSETITAQTLNDHMLTHDNPPLDLLIRTSGVSRLSDFMLWQSHQNTHIVFLDTLWPAFGLRDFLPVLWEWQRRIRKQGVNLSCEYESGDELEDGVSHSGRAGQHAKVL
jgi:undecaprenyl pyrophosphate synthase